MKTEAEREAPPTRPKGIKGEAEACRASFSLLMETRLFAIGTRSTTTGYPATVIEETKGYRVHYTLAGPLFFNNAFARLLFVQGASRPCLVTAGFVAQQDVQGIEEPLLGLSSLLPGPWVPLNSGVIPSLGSIGIRPVDDGSIKVKGKKNLFFLIQIASEHYVSRYGGAQGQVRSRAEVADTQYYAPGGEHE